MCVKIEFFFERRNNYWMDKEKDLLKDALCTCEDFTDIHTHTCMYMLYIYMGKSRREIGSFVYKRVEVKKAKGVLSFLILLGIFASLIRFFLCNFVLQDCLILLLIPFLCPDCFVYQQWLKSSREVMGFLCWCEQFWVKNEMWNGEIDEYEIFWDSISKNICSRDQIFL